MYSSIERQQYDEKQSFIKMLKKANDILTEIGSINEKLGIKYKFKQWFTDKRDQLELELSNYVDIKIDRVMISRFKIAGFETVIYNTNVKDYWCYWNQNSQIDKFNNIKYNPQFILKVYDSIKYNDNYTPKNYWW